MAKERVNEPESATFNPSRPPKPARKQVTLSLAWLWPLPVILLCVLCFLAGTAYGKHHAKTSNTSVATNGQGGFGGRFGGGGGRRGAIGDVTAVSSTSITVQDNFNNSSKTYSISSSTTVTNNGASASVSDIQTGDTVLIRTSSTSSSQAASIEINPSFGGGPGGQSSQGSTSN